VAFGEDKSMSEPVPATGERIKVREVTGLLHSRDALETAVGAPLEAGFDRADIAVAVKDGVVTLTGFVRSYSAEWEAERAASPTFLSSRERRGSRRNGVSGPRSEARTRARLVRASACRAAPVSRLAWPSLCALAWAAAGPVAIGSARLLLATLGAYRGPEPLGAFEAGAFSRTPPPLRVQTRCGHTRARQRPGCQMPDRDRPGGP
jgi:hypothetical protein